MLPPNFLQGKFKCKNLCLGSKRSKMLLLAIVIMQVKTKLRILQNPCVRKGLIMKNIFILTHTYYTYCSFDI